MPEEYLGCQKTPYVRFVEERSQVQRAMSSGSNTSVTVQEDVPKQVRTLLMLEGIYEAKPDYFFRDTFLQKSFRSIRIGT